MLQTVTARKSGASDLCHAVGDRDIGQAYASRKCGVIDALDSVCNDNTLKSHTVTESEPSDGVDMGRYGDADQTVTFLKRVLIDHLYAIRKIDLRETAASRERGIPDRSHSLGDVDRRHITATVKRAVADFFHASVGGDHAVFAPRDDLLGLGTDQTVSVAVVGFVILRDRDRRQPYAVRKQKGSDALHLGRYLHARQTAARAKGSVLYIG